MRGVLLPLENHSFFQPAENFPLEALASSFFSSSQYLWFLLIILMCP